MAERGTYFALWESGSAGRDQSSDGETPARRGCRGAGRARRRSGRRPGLSAGKCSCTAQFTDATGIPGYFCTRIPHGSAAATKPPTTCSASISRKVPTSRSTPPTTSTQPQPQPQPNSTIESARPSTGQTRRTQDTGTHTSTVEQLCAAQPRRPGQTPALPEGASHVQSIGHHRQESAEAAPGPKLSTSRSGGDNPKTRRELRETARCGAQVGGDERWTVDRQVSAGTNPERRVEWPVQRPDLGRHQPTTAPDR